ncbi:hypothetical protein BC832DRAFT_546030 [Gaertneriomyces semiglobifer]|nr:hypothetical protein BC832DRAFT_546030 [Gaertneriomyces semiglobifer]
MAGVLGHLWVLLSVIVTLSMSDLGVFCVVCVPVCVRFGEEKERSRKNELNCE